MTIRPATSSAGARRQSSGRSSSPPAMRIRAKPVSTPSSTPTAPPTTCAPSACCWATGEVEALAVTTSEGALLSRQRRRIVCVRCSTPSTTKAFRSARDVRRMPPHRCGAPTPKPWTGRCRSRCNRRSRLPCGVGIDRRNPRRRGGEGRFHRPRGFDESMRRSAGNPASGARIDRVRLVQQPDRAALRSQFRNGQRRRPLCAGERRARNGRIGESGLPGRRYARPDRLGGGRAERLRPENRRDAPHAPAGEAGRRTSSGSLGRSGRALAVRPGAVLLPGS